MKFVNAENRISDWRQQSEDLRGNGPLTAIMPIGIDDDGSCAIPAEGLKDGILAERKDAVLRFLVR